MKIYRPMISEDNKPVMVEEEPQDMGDDSDRCVMLDDHNNKIKELLRDVELNIATPIHSKESMKELREKYPELK